MKQEFSKVLADAAPSIDDGRANPLDQAAILIDCAASGLHCLIEAIRNAGGQEANKFDSAASGSLILLEMAFNLIVEANKKGNASNT